MRDCGDCRECCTGLLEGSSRGSWFGQMNPCKYLEDGCSIYDDRPGHCRRYYCGWAQGIIPAWLKPNETGVVVNVETDKDNKQFLNLVSTRHVDEKILAEINTFTNKNNTYYKVVRVIPLKVQHATAI